MKPTRHTLEFSTTIALSVSSLPRRTRPFRFTRSYSDARVKRRAFEKENEHPVDIIDCSSCNCRSRIATASLRTRQVFARGISRARRLTQCVHPYSKSLLPENLGRRLRNEEGRRI